MKGYRVLFKDFGRWVIDSDANGVSLIYAECIAAYHKDHGRETKIVNLDD